MQEKIMQARSLTAQLRAKEDSRIIEGYAAKFDTWSEPIYDWFVETIERGAFDEADMSDVIMCFNHDINHILSRTSSGTLKLKVDDIGLHFEFEAPNTTIGNDMLEMVRRGDISKCSFRFYIEEQKVTYRTEENGLKYDEHRITKFGVIKDVSLVVFPAYNDTEAKARFLEERKKVGVPVKIDTSSRDRLVRVLEMKLNQ